MFKSEDECEDIEVIEEADNSPGQRWCLQLYSIVGKLNGWAVVFCIVYSVVQIMLNQY